MLGCHQWWNRSLGSLGLFKVTTQGHFKKGEFILKILSRFVFRIILEGYPSGTLAMSSGVSPVVE